MFLSGHQFRHVHNKINHSCCNPHPCVQTKEFLVRQLNMFIKVAGKKHKHGIGFSAVVYNTPGKLITKIYVAFCPSRAVPVRFRWPSKNVKIFFIFAASSLGLLVDVRVPIRLLWVCVFWLLFWLKFIIRRDLIINMSDLLVLITYTRIHTIKGYVHLILEH